MALNTKKTVEWNSVNIILPLLKKLIKPKIGGRNVFSMGYIHHCEIDWVKNNLDMFFCSNAMTISLSKTKQKNYL